MAEFPLAVSLVLAVHSWNYYFYPRREMMIQSNVSAKVYHSRVITT